MYILTQKQLREKIRTAKITDLTIDTIKTSHCWVEIENEHTYAIEFDLTEYAKLIESERLNLRYWNTDEQPEELSPTDVWDEVHVLIHCIAAGLNFEITAIDPQGKSKIEAIEQTLTACYNSYEGENKEIMAETILATLVVLDDFKENTFHG